MPRYVAPASAHIFYTITRRLQWGARSLGAKASGTLEGFDPCKTVARNAHGPHGYLNTRGNCAITKKYTGGRPVGIACLIVLQERIQGLIIEGAAALASEEA